MRKFRHVYVDVYGVNVYFAKCTESMRTKLLKDTFGISNPIENGAVARVVRVDDNGHKGYVIWVSEWKYLTHELLHCVHWILDDRGLSLTDSSEEAYAYLIGYLDNELRKGI